MIHYTLRIIKPAVLILGILALGLAFLVYFLMDLYHRRQIARNARRLILSSKLFPPLGGEALRALWSKSGRGDREHIEDILVDMCRSPDNHVREAVERSIIEAGILERWLRGLRDGRVSRRVRSASRLGCVHDLRSVHALARAAGDSSPDVKLAVTLSLGRLKDPKGLPGLFHIASKPLRDVPDLTLAASLAACAAKSPGTVATFLQAREARQRIVGAWALSEVADSTVLYYLLAAARDPEAEVRAKVARALARISGPQCMEALQRLARDPVWFVRVRALDALGKLEASAGVQTVLEGLKDESREVRYRAAFALRSIGGMRADLATKVFHTLPRSSFEALVSEWDQAGFIWEVVSGLSTRDFPRFLESQVTARILIAAGVMRGLAYMLLVFPDVKVRLRLLRLFLEVPSPEVRSELLSLAAQPRCDRRVVGAIRRAFPRPTTRLMAEVKSSVA